MTVVLALVLIGLALGVLSVLLVRRFGVRGRVVASPRGTALSADRIISLKREDTSLRSSSSRLVKAIRHGSVTSCSWPHIVCCSRKRSLGSPGMDTFDTPIVPFASTSPTE
jgi:hypothetical protein